MESFQKAFGRHIRELRDQQGYTQEEFAHRAGMHVTYVSGIERGVRNPSLTKIHQLAIALGMTVGELFNFETSLCS